MSNADKIIECIFWIGVFRLFSTLCDNFCLWNREMLIG
ncbi:hypothetical protein C789_5297 [Microcystis aeruginosa FACHB-905 = DIANCHI905]|nr:hypothetical protein C789_5297 [Microcystis aeruginosa FACHB-905 = DIANCHI905]